MIRTIISSLYVGPVVSSTGDERALRLSTRAQGDEGGDGGVLFFLIL